MEARPSAGRYLVKNQLITRPRHPELCGRAALRRADAAGTTSDNRGHVDASVGRSATPSAPSRPTASYLEPT
jgi:hypothetical protein